MDENERKAAEKTSTGEHRALLDDIRQIVREETQNVLHRGDVPDHDEVEQMIAARVAMSEDDTRKLFDARIAPLEKQFGAFQTKLDGQLQKINDMLVGFVDGLKQQGKQIETIHADIQLFRGSVDAQIQRQAVQTDANAKRIDTTDQRVDLLSEATQPALGLLKEAVFGAADGTPGLRSQMSTALKTLAKVDGYIDSEVERRRAREKMVANVWKTLNYPVVKFALLGLLGSVMGVSLFEIMRAIG